jgi:hypothetical protein
MSDTPQPPDDEAEVDREIRIERGWMLRVKERRFTNRRRFGSAVWRPPLLGLQRRASTSGRHSYDSMLTRLDGVPPYQ